jgi:hypothetical protein
MTSREFYLQRRRIEYFVFVNLLGAIAAFHLSDRAHERSPSAERLVWALTNELQNGVEVASDDLTAWHQETILPLEPMIALYQQWSEE